MKVLNNNFIRLSNFWQDQKLSRKYRQRGLSLVEVLVSTAIFSFIILVVVSFFISMNSSNARTRADRETQENARRIMDAITNEVRDAKSVYTPTNASNQLSLETTKYLPTGETSTFIDFFLCNGNLPPPPTPINSLCTFNGTYQSTPFNGTVKGNRTNDTVSGTLLLSINGGSPLSSQINFQLEPPGTISPFTFDFYFDIAGGSRHIVGLGTNEAGIVIGTGTIDESNGVFAFNCQPIPTSLCLKKESQNPIILNSDTVEVDSLIFTTESSSAASLVQKAKNTGPLNTDVTWGSATTSGNFLVAVINVMSDIIPSITPPSGWTEAVSTSYGTTNKSAIFYKENAASETSTGSFLISGSGVNTQLIVAEYSGVAISSSLDKTASGSGIGNSPFTGTTAITSQANELLIAGLSSSSGYFTYPTNGFTIIEDETATAFLDRVVSATGNYSTGASVTSDDLPWGGVIATFKSNVSSPSQNTIQSVKINLTVKYKNPYNNPITTSSVTLTSSASLRSY